MLKGEISINRPSYSTGEEWIEFSLVDDLSSSEFLEARIKLDDFARALTGLSHVDCEFELRPRVVGMRYEHKEEQVPFKHEWVDLVDRKEVARKAFAPFEVDGWHGRVDDLFNHHRRAGKDAQRVTFTRHVSIEKESNK